MNCVAMNGSVTRITKIESMTAITHHKFINKDFHPIESNNWLIHMRYVRKEFDICKLLIEEELEKNHGCNEFANYILGLILRHEGKIQNSLEYFEKCSILNPLNAENLKQIGCSLFLMGHHSLAAQSYLKAEKISRTSDCNIHHSLGECYSSLGRFGKSREHFRKAVHLGRTEQSYKALAKQLIMENDINNAMEVYQAALEIFSSSNEIASELGLLYLRIGETQCALDKLGIALAYTPSDTKSLLALAALFQGHEEFDVALSKYKTTGQYLPESVPLWNNMGMCFYEKEKYIAAISCLKRAHYLDPLDWKTLYNLGLVHLHTKQYTSAFHYLSSTIKVKPRNASSFMLLAITLKNLGDNENALKCFEQGTKLDADDPGLRLNYVTHLYKMGEKNFALEQFNILETLLQNQPNIDIEIVKSVKQMRKFFQESKDLQSQSEMGTIEQVNENHKTNNINGITPESS